MARNLKALSGSSLPMDRLSVYEIDTGTPSLVYISHYLSKKKNALRMTVDHNFDAASELNIRSIPSLVMIKDGKILSEIVGSVSVIELEREIAANL